MASRFRTDEAGIELIERFEGYAKRQMVDGKWTGNYVSYRPTPDSNWTIGGGQEGALFPGTPGEIPVGKGTVITHQQAYDGVRFFVAQIVDPLVDKHFNPRTQAEHNACASWIYNIRHQVLEQGGYTLPEKVNARARDMDALISKWLQYCRTPGAENGLYKRRIAELLMFMGLPWNTPAVWGYIETAVFRRKDGTIDPTPFDFILSVAESAAAPKLESDDPNYDQYVKLGGTDAPVRSAPPPSPKPKPAAVAKPVPPIETPNLDVAAPPKPIEQSVTAKGMSNKDSGKETAAIGAVTTTGVFAMLPYAEKIAAFAERTNPKVILFSIGAVAAVFLIVGVLRWWIGKMQMYDGRLNATETKI